MDQGNNRSSSRETRNNIGRKRAREKYKKVIKVVEREKVTCTKRQRVKIKSYLITL